MLFPLKTTRPRKRSLKKFTPAHISGVYGWWDISDISTLYQDKAMTTPVTADGQDILAIANKISGGNPLILGSYVAEPPSGGYPKYRAARVNGLGMIENFLSSGSTHATYFETDPDGDITDFYFASASERKVEGQTGNLYYSLYKGAMFELNLSASTQPGSFYPWINSYGQNFDGNPSHVVAEMAVISWWCHEGVAGSEFSKNATERHVAAAALTEVDHPIDNVMFMGHPGKSTGFTGEMIAARTISIEDKILLDTYLTNKWV